MRWIFKVSSSPQYVAKPVVIGKESIMKNKHSSHDKHCHSTLPTGHSCWTHYFLNNMLRGFLSLFWHQHIVISEPRVCNHIKYTIRHQWITFTCTMLSVWDLIQPQISFRHTLAVNLKVGDDCVLKANCLKQIVALKNIDDRSPWIKHSYTPIARPA